LQQNHIQHLLIFVRAAINEEMMRRLVHYNYPDEIKVPKRLKNVDQGFMSDQEIGAVLFYFRNNGQRRDELILWILHACALRPGELFALRWNDWDPHNPDHLRIDEAFGKSGLDDPKLLAATATYTCRMEFKRSSRSGKRGAATAVRKPSCFIEAGHADSLRQLFETCAQAGRRGSWSRRHHAPDVAPVVLDDGVGFRGIT
jgi:hypothetical protein